MDKELGRGFLVSVIASLAANVIYYWFGAPALQSVRLWAVLVPVALNVGIMGLFSWLHRRAVLPRFDRVDRTLQELQDAKTAAQQQAQQQAARVTQLQDELRTQEQRLRDESGKIIAHLKAQMRAYGIGDIDQ